MLNNLFYLGTSFHLFQLRTIPWFLVLLRQRHIDARQCQIPGA
jgi:hypothetical protein